MHGDGLFPNAALYAGREEAEAYRDKAAYYRFFGFDLWERLMPGIPQIAFADAIARELPADVLASPGFREIPLAGTFKDGDVFDLGKRRVTAVHLPGHTAGHYGFYLEERGIIFPGPRNVYEMFREQTGLMTHLRRLVELGAAGVSEVS